MRSYKVMELISASLIIRAKRTAILMDIKSVINIIIFFVCLELDKRVSFRLIDLIELAA